MKAETANLKNPLASGGAEERVSSGPRIAELYRQPICHHFAIFLLPRAITIEPRYGSADHLSVWSGRLTERKSQHGLRPVVWSCPLLRRCWPAGPDWPFQLSNPRGAKLPIGVQGASSLVGVQGAKPLGLLTDGYFAADDIGSQRTASGIEITVQPTRSRSASLLIVR